MFTKNEQDLFFKAVESRDYRFDGRFFVAVKTTGIYCRPVCPAKPKRQNIVFFKTAVAAENAGFRPCLRCRPETAPQSPAWVGKSAIVRRAIGLISEGYLFQFSEQEFALKLGVSDRHLRRLFVNEIGLTPKQVSDNQRINFARSLVIETKIAITEIAFSSGFKSIRRFNDAFQKNFSKKPSEIRKKVGTLKANTSTTLTLRYRPPYDWDSIISYLKLHSIPGAETVVDDIYQRLFIDEHTGKAALIEVSNCAEKNYLRLNIYNSNTRSLFSISRKIRRMFDLDSDPILIANTFAKSRFLKKIYLKYPGLRIPSSWNGFEAIVATVLGQFVSVEQGRKLLSQLVREHGTVIKHELPSELSHGFPTPETLERAALLTVKITNQQKETIRQLSQMVRSKKLNVSEFSDLSILRSTLREVKGIGPWSVEYICLSAIGDANAFPSEDLILKRVLALHPEIKSEEIEPWRSYLAFYLWREFATIYSKKRGLKNVV